MISALQIMHSAYSTIAESRDKVIGAGTDEELECPTLVVATSLKTTQSRDKPGVCLGWSGGGLGVIWGWSGGGLGVVWRWSGGGLGVVGEWYGGCLGLGAQTPGVVWG